MQQVSAAFHAAVKNGSPQRATVRFLADDRVLTGEAIADTGITVIDGINESEDLTVGECVASEARLTIYNDDGAMDGYAYGEAEISLGVKVNGEWEDCSLGIFNLQSKKKKSIRVELTGRDRMERFDVSVSQWWHDLSYPITLGALLTGLCAEVGVPYTPAAFLNSTLTLTEAPLGASGLTGREVLRWIAEAACSYAKINRSGALELRWWRSSGQTVARRGANTPELAEFRVGQIDRLHVITAQSDLGVLVPESGTTECEYIMVDNPFLYGMTEADIRAKGQPIYERLISMPTYTPMSVETRCGDWSIEAGDTVEVETVAGMTQTLPIFRQEIRWCGGCRIYYEATGNESRQAAGSAIRKLFDQSWRYFKLETSIEGLTAEIGGKLDGEQCQALITASMEEISLGVTSGESGSKFTIYHNGVEISSETLDLHVKSVNVDGTITADAINLNTAQITGTLAASNIDASSLHVNWANIDNVSIQSAQIDTLYANKIVGGATGGYIAAGALSDAGNFMSHLYAERVTSSLNRMVSIDIISNQEATGVNATINANGISAGGKSIGWAELVEGGSGGTAVFG